MPKQHLAELGSISSFYQKRVILAIFGGVGRLPGQFWAPKLHLIDSSMERDMVGHGLRNILGPRVFVIGPPRPELQCKTYQFSGLPTFRSDISQPVRAQLKPSRLGGIDLRLETGIFWILTPRKKFTAFLVQICHWPYLAKTLP